MPGAQSARLTAVVRRIRKDRSNERKQPSFFTQAPFALLVALTKIVLDNGVIEECLDVLVGFRLYGAVNAVTGREADPDMLGFRELVVATTDGEQTWAWQHRDGDRSSPVASTLKEVVHALAHYHRTFKATPVISVPAWK